MSVALVTGASRGIGRSIALAAAREGYDVCINFATGAEEAATVGAACRALGVRTIEVQADVADRAQVATLFERCDQALGPVDLLVNNAGIVGRATRLAGLDQEDLQRTFEVNLFGTVYCCQEAIARMSSKRGGRGGAIVNISSIAATLGSPGEYVHYAASKGAVDTLTVGLAKEVGPEGIRVNGVQVGTTDTGIHARVGVPERPAMIARTAPLGRVGQPEDMAEAVIWLGSDSAGYVTGAILRVGGGI